MNVLKYDADHIVDPTPDDLKLKLHPGLMWMRSGYCKKVEAALELDKAKHKAFIKIVRTRSDISMALNHKVGHSFHFQIFHHYSSSIFGEKINPNTPILQTLFFIDGNNWIWNAHFMINEKLSFIPYVFEMVKVPYRDFDNNIIQLDFMKVNLHKWNYLKKLGFIPDFLMSNCHREWALEFNNGVMEYVRFTRNPNVYFIYSTTA